MSPALRAPPGPGARPSRSPGCMERSAVEGARSSAAGRLPAGRQERCRFRTQWRLARLRAPPVPARSRRPWRRPQFALVLPLNVEVADALGVRLDELLARFHVRSHQLLERVVDRGCILDLDLEQHAALRVHGRLPQLLSIHLAETLHARGLRVFSELAESFVAVALGMAPNDLLAFEDLEQRRLRHVEVSALDDLREIAEEESQQQRAN